MAVPLILVLVYEGSELGFDGGVVEGGAAVFVPVADEGEGFFLPEGVVGCEGGGGVGVYSGDEGVVEGYGAQGDLSMRVLGYITWQVFDVEGRNDLRDWDRVREYARRFANSLREWNREVMNSHHV